jgi:hypothetical protein
MKNTAMEKPVFPCLLAVLILFLLSSPVFPADRFEPQDTLEVGVQGDVLDIALSDDGRWTFVLTSRGEVTVLDHAGRVTQTIAVGGGVDRLEYSGNGDRLLLGGGHGKVRIITLSMRYDIDTSGSPWRGPEKAPVTIAFFIDYQ